MKVYEVIEALMAVEDQAVVAVNGHEVTAVTVTTETVDGPNGEQIEVERVELQS